MHGFCHNRGIEFVEGLKPGTGIRQREIILPAKCFFLTPKNMETAEMVWALLKQKFYSIGWKHCTSDHEGQQENNFGELGDCRWRSTIVMIVINKHAIICM